MSARRGLARRYVWSPMCPGDRSSPATAGRAASSHAHRSAPGCTTRCSSAAAATSTRDGRPRTSSPRRSRVIGTTVGRMWPRRRHCDCGDPSCRCSRTPSMRCIRPPPSPAAGWEGWWIQKKAGIVEGKEELRFCIPALCPRAT